MVSVKYDKANDATVVSLAPVGESQAFALSVMYECPGKAACRPPMVMVTLSTSSPRPLYQNADNVRLTVAGSEPVTFVPQYSARAERGTVRETVFWLLPTEQFLALARAASVGVAVGGLDTAFSPEHSAGVLLIARRIESVPEN